MRIFQKVTQLVTKRVGPRYASSCRNNLKSTYNDLPSPCGSWKMGNAEMQRKNNLMLGTAIGLFLGTVLVGKYGGCFEFYNHFPARPADSNDYKAGL